jgi:hypothetical protein
MEPHSRIASGPSLPSSIDSDVVRYMVISGEIGLLQQKLQPHDTGHIHTAISVLKDRQNELLMSILTTHPVE